MDDRRASRRTSQLQTARNDAGGWGPRPMQGPRTCAINLVLPARWCASTRPLRNRIPGQLAASSSRDDEAFACHAAGVVQNARSSLVVEVRLEIPERMQKSAARFHAITAQVAWTQPKMKHHLMIGTW